MYWYMNKVVFGEWVQSELDKREMTIADLARLGDARNPVLWRIIKGERNAGIDSIIAIARGLNISPFEVFGRAIGQEMGAKDAEEEHVLILFRLFPEGERERIIAYMEALLNLLER